MTVELLDRLENAKANSAAGEVDGRESDVFGRLGTLEVRLARNAGEVRASQAMRYRIFVEEMKARLPSEAMRLKLDFDAFDDICDHLLVLDRAIEGDPEDQIVGTYRLLRHEVALANSGFYSASEFAIGALLERHPEKRFMELGRSCVLPDYRTKRTVELLWQGNWAYSLRYNIDALFGCASFPGIQPEKHALALSFLAQNASAKDEWAVEALPELFCTMDLMPSEIVDARRAVASMPPLVKGYLRIGAMVGTGAVIDHAFNTTDVLIVLPLSSLSGRFLNYYGASAGRFAS
jgi:L-ornithine Nalpha-acyltransferase